MPLRRLVLPFTDFHTIASHLNAYHPYLNSASRNKVGKGIKILIDNNKLHFLGPNFPIYFSYNSATTHGIVLAKNKTYHNITIKPGPLTSSDHLPMIINISQINKGLN